MTHNTTFRKTTLTITKKNKENKKDEHHKLIHNTYKNTSALQKYTIHFIV